MTTTAKSIQGFNADLGKFSAKCGIALQTLVRRVALEVYTGVTVKTPVDTGRARASWNMTTGRIDLSVAPEVKHGGAKGHPIQSATLTGVNAKQLEGLTGAQPVAIGKIGTAYLIDPIYITNNLPYIIYLEEGSSSQATNGMVAVTLAEVESRLTSEMRKL